MVLVGAWLCGAMPLYPSLAPAVCTETGWSMVLVVVWLFVVVHVSRSATKATSSIIHVLVKLVVGLLLMLLTQQNSTHVGGLRMMLMITNIIKIVGPPGRTSPSATALSQTTPASALLVVDLLWAAMAP
jgi:hypothetical protein